MWNRIDRWDGPGRYRFIAMDFLGVYREPDENEEYGGEQKSNYREHGGIISKTRVERLACTKTRGINGYPYDSPDSGVTSRLFAEVNNRVETVSDFSSPGSCYADANGRVRPKAALLYIDTIGRWRVVDETACLTWEHDLTEGTEWFYPLCAYG